MTSQAQIMSVLSKGGWMPTKQIAQAIPYTCRDFSTHRQDVYAKLNIMWKRGEVEKASFSGTNTFWRIPA